MLTFWLWAVLDLMAGNCPVAEHTMTFSTSLIFPEKAESEMAMKWLLLN